MRATRYRRTQTVTMLLQKGADKYQEDNTRETALMIAAMDEHTQILTMILEKDANLNKANTIGQTALKVTAMCGHKGP